MESKQKCSVCDSDIEYYFNQRILNKYDVDYFYCNHCGLLQTEKPYWLEEAYGNAIADADTGLVDRNIAISHRLASVLFFLFNKDGKYLDVAGGYGMLTRLMRDIGFDFYWSDIYCQNILAKGFESSTTNVNTSPFDAITAFEVLEHVHDPLDFLRESLKSGQTSTIIFTTELFSGTPPQPSDWYYYVPNMGQHISFYQLKTLQFIADRLSLNLYSCGKRFHILTDKKILHPFVWKLLASPISEITRIYVKLSMKSKSKTFPDHCKILKEGE